MQQRYLGTTGLKVSRLGARHHDLGHRRRRARGRRSSCGRSSTRAAPWSTPPRRTDAARARRLIGTLLADRGRPRRPGDRHEGAGSPRRDGESVRDTSRGAMLRDPRRVAGAAGRRPRRPLAGPHLVRRRSHSRRRSRRSTPPCRRDGRAMSGVSNYSGWQTAQAATHQRAAPGRVRLASTQVEYSLLQRGIEREVVPAAGHLGLGILPWSPLGRGVLTGKYRTGVPADSRGASADLRAVRRRAPERRRPPGSSRRSAGPPRDWTCRRLQVALAWVRDQPGVAAPIVGARTAAQLAAVAGRRRTSTCRTRSSTRSTTCRPRTSATRRPDPTRQSRPALVGVSATVDVSALR